MNDADKGWAAQPTRMFMVKRTISDAKVPTFDQPGTCLSVRNLQSFLLDSHNVRLSFA
jgi:hypothetical protein